MYVLWPWVCQYMSEASITEGQKLVGKIIIFIAPSLIN